MVGRRSVLGGLFSAPFMSKVRAQASIAVEDLPSFGMSKMGIAELTKMAAERTALASLFPDFVREHFINDSFDKDDCIKDHYDSFKSWSAVAKKRAFIEATNERRFNDWKRKPMMRVARAQMRKQFPEAFGGDYD